MPPLPRGTRARLLLAGAAVCALLLSPAAAAATPATSTPPTSTPAATAPAAASPSLPPGGEATLMRYAEDTWASFVAMTDEDSGLPADKLSADGTRSVQTSTTNIGAYMWSTLVAERLGLVDHDEAVSRLSTTLSTLEGMEVHEPSGQYFNWYDHRTGEKLTTWPPTGNALVPHLSSVDNGWLATALHMVATSVPEVSDDAQALFDGMDFGFFYRPDVNRILFHYRPSTGEEACCYDTIVSESRIASYIGIAKGEIPPRHYYGAFRTFPDSCDWSFQETRPTGYDRSLYGEDVYEGAYPYAGTQVTPGWGGSMFEALMPDLFVPENDWGAGSWRQNHPLTVAGQIHHGMTEAAYGYWGFSPANVPEGGYKAYGVDGMGMDPNGYPSNNDDTTVDAGFAGCDGRDPQPAPSPDEYTNGVVTPHAAFLGLRYAPEQALANLERLEQDFDIYTDRGFLDTVNVDTGRVSDSHLSLDQGMIMAALGNALADDMLRDAFVTPEFTQALRPPMGVEEFNTRPRGCTVTGTGDDDTLVGTPGDDVLCGLGGDDTVDGLGGDDVLYGDAGEDTLRGGDGADTAYGDGGDDAVAGGAGEDVVTGGPGDDALAGGPGRDHHEGGAGDDRCPTTSGSDTSNACG